MRCGSLREEVLVINTRAIFCLLLFFVGMNFHTQNKSTIRFMFYNPISKGSPTPSPHELTCSYYCRGDEGEEVEQDENRGGVCYKRQILESWGRSQGM